MTRKKITFIAAGNVFVLAMAAGLYLADHPHTALNDFNQTHNFMNTSGTILFTAMLTLFAGFQAVIGQAQDIYRSTQELLDELKQLKKDVDDGKITAANWQQQGRMVRGLIIETLNAGERKKRIEGDGYTEAGKKALEETYKAVVKSLAGKGISNEEPMDEILKLLYNELTTTIESVKNYNAGDLFMVSGTEAPWLLRALSKKELQRWEQESIKDWNSFAPINKKKFDEAFKELNTLALKKIPAFKPNPKNFATRNAAEETLMKKQLPAIKIHQIGLAQTNWEIQKNELDIIQKRFKVGYVWGKDPNDDFQFCRLYQVNIIQDYAGGGKYNASEAVAVGSWVVGCP
jgi:hypothetical protein